MPAKPSAVIAWWHPKQSASRRHGNRWSHLPRGCDSGPTFARNPGNGIYGRLVSVQVKQRDKVGRPDIDNFEAVMIREDHKLGYFVGFDFSGDALFEIDRFRRKEGREIKP